MGEKFIPELGADKLKTSSFLYFMMIWLIHKERGEEMPLPSNLPYSAKKLLKRHMRELEKLYNRKGADYLKQVLAEAKEKGYMYDPDELIKKFSSGD